MCYRLWINEGDGRVLWVIEKYGSGRVLWVIEKYGLMLLGQVSFPWTVFACYNSSPLAFECFN